MGKQKIDVVESLPSFSILQTLMVPEFNASRDSQLLEFFHEPQSKKICLFLANHPLPQCDSKVWIGEEEEEFTN
jgi:hypothetical protein